MKTLWSEFKDTLIPKTCDYCTNMLMLYEFEGETICKACLKEAEYEEVDNSEFDRGYKLGFHNGQHSVLKEIHQKN